MLVLATCHLLVPRKSLIEKDETSETRGVLSYQQREAALKLQDDWQRVVFASLRQEQRLQRLQKCYSSVIEIWWTTPHFFWSAASGQGKQKRWLQRQTACSMTHDYQSIRIWLTLKLHSGMVYLLPDYTTSNVLQLSFIHWTTFFPNRVFRNTWCRWCWLNSLPSDMKQNIHVKQNKPKAYGPNPAQNACSNTSFNFLR